MHTVAERNVLIQPIIFRVHVSFPECVYKCVSSIVFADTFAMHNYSINLPATKSVIKHLVGYNMTSFASPSYIYPA